MLDNENAHDDFASATCASSGPEQLRYAPAAVTSNGFGARYGITSSRSPAEGRVLGTARLKLFGRVEGNGAACPYPSSKSFLRGKRLRGWPERFRLVRRRGVGVARLALQTGTTEQ